MASFQKALEAALQNEGIFSNDPIDPGGMTYKGIARKRNPSWQGWLIIDQATGTANFLDDLEHNAHLQELVVLFYRQMYWDRIQGDRLPGDKLGTEMMDNAINMGVTRSVTFLQQALNFLNRNGTTYPNIAEDGDFGQETIDTLDTFVKLDKTTTLLNVINVLQGCFYLGIMKKTESQERFCRGWFSRIEIIKN